jgi:7-carboxy-7-deazaguanine synthase
LSGTFDWVTISPKINMPGKKRVLVEVLRQADEVKMPVGCQLDIDNLPDVLKHCRQGVRVSLQPLSTSKAATELCYKTCLERGWNLSLQTHKWIGAK